jgi:hypothetical protein
MQYTLKLTFLAKFKIQTEPNRTFLVRFGKLSEAHIWNQHVKIYQNLFMLT